VFRDVQRTVYEDELNAQIVAAQAGRGPGDLAKLISTTGTWDVG
jgi:hypothetical protein